LLDEPIKRLAASEPFERLLLARERPIRARAEAGEGAALAALAVALDASLLAVAPGPREADALAEELAAYLGDDRVAHLPAWEALPYEGISPSPEVAARRADALAALRRAHGPFVLVAPALAAMQAVIPTLGTIDPLDLTPGRELPPDHLAARLDELGYRRVDVVEHRGEFAVRGGVVDVFPGTARRPVRVDYWGDEIESLRTFTPSTQLSTERIGHVAVGPVRELIPDAAVRDRAERRAPDHVERFRDGLQRIADGLHPEGMETLAPLLFDEMPTPADLLPDGSWVVVTREARTLDRASQAHTEADALADALAWPGARPLRSLGDAIGDRVRLHLTEFTEVSTSRCAAGAAPRGTRASSSLG
jgi:transcription-repair coupling factor (superfamily II helicase)